MSGQPESKASVVAITRFEAAWYGFAVAANRPIADVAYWARVRCDAGWRMELAGARDVADWTAFAQDLFGLGSEPQIWTDAQGGKSRLGFVTDSGALAAALFVASEPVQVARDFVAGLLGQPAKAALAARPERTAFDAGPTVWSCLGVGQNSLLLAAHKIGPDLDRVCAATGAGLTCGSCRPEIQRLVNRFALREAAE